MIATVEELVTVTYSVCDGCGRRDATEAAGDAGRFDPRSRSAGFAALWLWDRHPNDRKHFCAPCLESGRHAVAGYTAKPEDVVRGRIYEVSDCDSCGGIGCQVRGCQQGKRYGDNGMGLRLPERPISDWGAVSHAGLVLAEDRQRALLLACRNGHWMPASPMALLGSHLGHGLVNGDAFVLLMEHTSRTPFRTVYEIRCDEEPDIGPALVAERYGETWEERLCARDGRVDDGVEVLLRVPSEILQ